MTFEAILGGGIDLEFLEDTKKQFDALFQRAANVFGHAQNARKQTRTEDKLDALRRCAALADSLSAAALVLAEDLDSVADTKASA